jgi:hypothetical protein
VAQSDSVALSLKERLARPAQKDSLTIVHQTVNITEHGDAAPIVSANLKGDTKWVSGYRIVIFMNMTPSARRDAVVAQESFATLFPNEHTYLFYENPYFKVTVGNCTSQEEALTLLGKIRHAFPKAFIMRENIPISELSR